MICLVSEERLFRNPSTLKISERCKDSPMPIHQYMCFFGTTIPWYGICVGVAMLVVGFWTIRNFKIYSMDTDQQNEILFGIPFMMLTGVAFAFFFDAAFTGDWRTWMDPRVRRVGFTFAGWLFGVVLFIFVFGGFTSFGRMFLLNMFLPIFAIAQGIGRVGCFLGGCCYGKVCAWGVKYPPGSFPFERIGEVRVFPVQLVEAGLLFCLFGVCLKVPFRHRAVVYLLGIGILRFVLEHFRGDDRGSFLGVVCLSPQQILSILFLLVGLVILVQGIKR